MTEEYYIQTAIAALALLKSGKGTIATVRTWLREFDTASSSVEGAEEFLRHAGVTRLEVNGSFGHARADIEKGLALGVRPVPINAPEYPPSLRAIADAPPIIYVRGSIKLLATLPGIAIVGTRKATLHGLTIAERIANHVSKSGVCVVSGLALGIDAAAHEGALQGNTPTIAVLAHGLERASPRANEHLALRILENGGAWISEHSIGTPAKPEYFVQRNRIQVGLSAASVIVEGALNSGSMTQAEYCMRYRRELFAVVPSRDGPASTQSTLPRMLVKDRGARAIETYADYPTLLAVAAARRAELLHL